MRNGGNFLSIRNVHLTYGRRDKTEALKEFDLNVSLGEFVAIVGPSGCGKSSLMKLVTGLLLPSQGQIKVNGTVVDGPLKIVGMAFQNPTLLPWRKVLSNIVLPFEIVDEHRHKIRSQRHVYEEKARRLLNAVGLPEVENRFPWQLSGGMQQRVSLCRALVHEPALLLLDEPFGALDAFTREDLWDVLQDLWMKRKFTVIFVTHDLHEAVYLADKIHVMSRRPGRIIASYDVPIARPRREETAFEPVFIDIVHSLRRLIKLEMDGREHAGATREVQ